MSEHDKLLDQTARQIEKLTAEAFAELMRRIRAGEDPQSAIQAIMQTWEPACRERLAEAFSATLARFVGPDELRDYPIGEMALSPRLYAHAATTTVVVRDIVQRHAAGFQDARRLTLEIFEGYGFRKDEPLKISPNNPKLPKYLRREILTDPDLAGQLARHFTRVQAATLKTPALRAAYLEAIDAMEKGMGSKALERKLEVAYQERMRYHANRIAQTELHRAWMDKQAEELMADDTVEVVQFKMSGTHPRTDICDLFAKQDAYGLGPGLYPKEHAPRPPLHPFCRCGLISKRLISAKGAQFKPEAHRVYLRQVMAEEGVSKAAQVVGSRAKLQQVLNGADPVELLNAKRDPLYRVKRVGEVDGMNWPGQQVGSYPAPAVRTPEQMAPRYPGRDNGGMTSDAYAIAKSGGRHSGTYRRYQNARTQEIEKSIRSIDDQIRQHEEKMRNPRSFFTDASDTEIGYLVSKFWPKEINNLRQQRAVMAGILSEREE